MMLKDMRNFLQGRSHYPYKIASFSRQPIVSTFQLSSKIFSGEIVTQLSLNWENFYNIFVSSQYMEQAQT